MHVEVYVCMWSLTSYGVVNVPCNPQLLLHSLLCTIVLSLHTSVHYSIYCICLLICIHALCLIQCVSLIVETEGRNTCISY